MTSTFFRIAETRNHGSVAPTAPESHHASLSPGLPTGTVGEMEIKQISQHVDENTREHVCVSHSAEWIPGKCSLLLSHV